VAGYADDIEEQGRSRRAGVRLRFGGGGLLPKTVWGRIAAGCGVVLLAGLGITGYRAVSSFLLRDPHFKVAGPASIQIAGNSRLTRPQLLSVFGGDVERNIFTMPLAERRAELERLPWVAHATVMRLLPDRVRVAIVERTPVAFVRQGREIGLVDANGVLLDLGRPLAGGDGETAASKAADYSFPVMTGISTGEPLSTRAARMKIYLDFVAALDASGEKISRRVSEVDVSNPEDVQAILSDGDAAAQAAGASGILVHFGDERYLERYHQYAQHLAEWRAQYPRLASVDMRYERQVVLEMQKGAEAESEVAADKAAASAAAASTAGTAAKRTAGPVVTPSKSVPAKSVVTASNPAVVAKSKPPRTAEAPPAPHLTTSFSVPSPLATGKPKAVAAQNASQPQSLQGAPR
jgi:cell division protein FtsQ